MAESALEPAQLLRQLFVESVQAVDPGPLVSAELVRTPMTSDAITVLGLGKSAVPMASAALRSLGRRVTAICVVAPTIPPNMGAGWMASSHPAASELSVEAARALMDAAGRAQGEILFLLSGGGSALAALPPEGLSLADKNELVSQVYSAGAAIGELNLVRRHLSIFKGGGLAAAASVPITTLLVSDVIGDVLHTVSSGPTIPDASSPADALSVVEYYLGKEDGPAAAYLRKRAGEQGTGKDAFSSRGDRQRLLAGMGALAREARRLASQKGVQSQVYPGELHGSVESVAKQLLLWSKGPGLWIAASEASVNLVDTPGTGGRAQHLALTIAREIQGPAETHLLVAGSDGIDGNSSAAGAIVDNTSWQRLKALGVDAEVALQRCDAGTALRVLDAQIITGETGVNHADLILLRRS